MFHIGIVTTRVSIHAVALLDGKYHSKMMCDLEPELGEGSVNRYNRNYHLGKIYEEIDTFIDRIVSLDDDLRVIVQSVVYDTNKRVLVETAQTVGVILSLPYTVHEVSQWSWKNHLIGKGGVTEDEVRDAISGRFGLQGEFGSNQNWFDAFCVARFGYLKDQSNT